MRDDLTFYATAAQIIPVLFLALVFELRQPKPEQPVLLYLDLACFLFGVAFLVIGEAVALHVVATGEVSEDQHNRVVSAFQAGAVMVVLQAGVQRLGRAPVVRAHPVPSVLVVIAWVVFVSVVLAGAL